MDKVNRLLEIGRLLTDGCSSTQQAALIKEEQELLESLTSQEWKRYQYLGRLEWQVEES